MMAIYWDTYFSIVSYSCRTHNIEYCQNAFALYEFYLAQIGFKTRTNTTDTGISELSKTINSFCNIPYISTGLKQATDKDGRTMSQTAVVLGYVRNSKQEWTDWIPYHHVAVRWTPSSINQCSGYQNIGNISLFGLTDPRKLVMFQSLSVELLKEIVWFWRDYTEVDPINLKDWQWLVKIAKISHLFLVLVRNNLDVSSKSFPCYSPTLYVKKLLSELPEVHWL